MNIGTVFSGIGAPEQAFNGILGHNKVKVLFACDNGEREVSYDLKNELKELEKITEIPKKTEYINSLYNRLTKKENYIEKTYLNNYGDKVSFDNFYQDIYLLNGLDYRHKVDLLVGGSPCQSFSTVGKQLGLKDTRGTLFYEFARLVKEIEPKVFIYENVRGLLTNDKGNTFKTILHILNDELHYHISYDVFNALNLEFPKIEED